MAQKNEAKIRGLVGWELPVVERNRLRATFPAHYAVDSAIQHHITLKLGVAPDFPLPTATRGTVVGHADDGRGVQALVVEIDGSVHRPDGNIYHITWSLDRAVGRKPGDSNKILAHGWKPVPPVSIALVPKFFRQ